MYSIQFTESAEEDLLEALHYISDVLKAPVAAKDLFYDLKNQLNILEQMPFSCPLVNDEYLAMKGIRSVIVKNYLVFYIFKEAEGVISIIRFLYARRDWLSLLKDASR